MIAIPKTGQIALVDDDPIDRMIITRVIGLSHLENPVQEYDSGTKFIEALERLGDETTEVALVLMDINMPGMTGLEALAHIRNVSCLPDLPIIVMLTSSEAKADIAQAELLGAHGYLVKQSGLDAFVESINEALSNQGSQ